MIVWSIQVNVCWILIWRSIIPARHNQLINRARLISGERIAANKEKKYNYFFHAHTFFTYSSIGQLYRMQKYQQPGNAACSPKVSTANHEYLYANSQNPEVLSKRIFLNTINIDITVS